MKKITKQQKKEFLKEQLGKNLNWALQGLVRIYEYQTNDEQENEVTSYHNDVGFTGADAELLTSFAKQYLKRGFLTPKQQNILFKKMPKYWQQLLKISDEEKLESLISK